jgi:hypothetical protein
MPFRNGSGPIRSDTGVHTCPSSVDPFRYRSLYISVVLARSYTRAYTSPLREGSDPIRSDTGAYAPPSSMDPVRPDPIPLLILSLPERIRFFKARCLSLCTPSRNGSDVVQSDTGACTAHSGMGPVRYRSLYIPFWNRYGPIRSDTGAYACPSGSDPIPFHSAAGAYTFPSGMDQIISDSIPELRCSLPERIRPYPTRYSGL